MTEENFDETHKKFFKHFSNGILRNLILWIISRQSVHGYGIMKILDEFFSFEEAKCDMNINSSKIYPILSGMEKKELIKGEWKVNENNKRVKYYSITEEGIVVLEDINNHMNIILSNPSWLTFFEDMTGKEINDEKCD